MSQPRNEIFFIKKNIKKLLHKIAELTVINNKLLRKVNEAFLSEENLTGS